jgi:DNA-binding MarR family transcriptional regulator
MASRVVTRLYDRHFAGSGIEPTQFTLLVAIRLAEPVSVVQLANLLGLDRTTLTRNLRLLQQSALVRTDHAADARKRLLSLTEKGRQSLRNSLPRWKRAQEAALACLGNAKFARFSDALALARKLGDDHGD